jgi:Uma2 family endonuclease
LGAALALVSQRLAYTSLMHLALAEFALHARLRPARPLPDLEIMQFCTENEMLRVERDSNGDLILMSSTGLEGSNWNTEVSADLSIRARKDGRGKVFDSDGGFTLPDGSMRSPDAAWVSLQRWNFFASRRAKSLW